MPEFPLNNFSNSPQNDPDYDPENAYLPHVTEPSAGGPGVSKTAAEGEEPSLYDEFEEAEAMTEGPTPEEEVHPEELAANSIYDLLALAIQQRRLIQVIYTSAHKGTTKTYIAEPYEIKGHGQYPAGYLWIFDTAEMHTKSLFLANINDVQLLDSTFIPRFE